MIVSLNRDLLPIKKRLCQKEDISQQTIKELEFQNCRWGLDDAEMFDGHFFREWDGTILPSHPSIIYIHYQNWTRLLTDI